MTAAIPTTPATAPRSATLADGDAGTADAQREAVCRQLDGGQELDLLIAGGGATGLGIALDAALRGLKVALVERGDFAQGTSSRSTKLVHGGVRYLAQGHIGLVNEALRERACLLANAPHIARPLSFVMPAYGRWQQAYYGAGLLAYDLLAGRAGLGRTRLLGRDEVRQRLPGLRGDGLSGGVSYWDGQFDDARLAVILARSAQHHGALMLNHCEVRAVRSDGVRVSGADLMDRERGRRFTVNARCVINATGVWVEKLLSGSEGRPLTAGDAPAAMVRPSQGLHLTFDRELLPGDDALLWPRTRDGRVLFAVPWLGKTIVGTTDHPRADLPAEPEPLPGEVDELLSECSRFLAAPPRRQDIRSAWVGLRPLVSPPPGTDPRHTRAISREHAVLLRSDGLVTVTGGKWTTYRSIAQDVLDRCIASALLPPCGPCRTAATPLMGASTLASTGPSLSQLAGLHSYGDEAEQVALLPGAQRTLAPGLTEAMVRFAVRHEFARNVEDVLARRSRLLFLDARLASEVAPAVAEIIATETAASPRLAAFLELAARHVAPPA